MTLAADRRHSGFPPPVFLSTDSGNDDLARGEGEDVEEKDSDRLLGLAVGDSVIEPKMEMLC